LEGGPGGLFLGGGRGWSRGWVQKGEDLEVEVVQGGDATGRFVSGGFCELVGGAMRRFIEESLLEDVVHVETGVWVECLDTGYDWSGSEAGVVWLS